MDIELLYGLLIFLIVLGIIGVVALAERAGNRRYPVRRRRSGSDGGTASSGDSGHAHGHGAHHGGDGGGFDGGSSGGGDGGGGGGGD